MLFEIFFSFEESWSSILYNVLQSAFEDFLGGTEVKDLPASAGEHETQVRSLGWEDPLEKGNPLQYSCLENPMDREARQATVHGVAKSGT